MSLNNLTILFHQETGLFLHSFCFVYILCKARVVLSAGFSGELLGFYICEPFFTPPFFTQLFAVDTLG
jgi:hypothetical protein